MPSYAWDILITANKLEKTPVEKELNLTIGVITKIAIKFPPGCHGMVRVRLLHRRFQLIPLSGGEWVTGDGETVPFPEYFELKETPADLNFIGCSPGTGHNHTITVRITVLPKAVATFIPLIDVMTKFLKRIGVIR